jgi:hypothetical protein
MGAICSFWNLNLNTREIGSLLTMIEICTMYSSFILFDFLYRSLQVSVSQCCGSLPNPEASIWKSTALRPNWESRWTETE